jgi:hypothetical protein
MSPCLRLLPIAKSENVTTRMCMSQENVFSQLFLDRAVDVKSTASYARCRVGCPFFALGLTRSFWQDGLGWECEEAGVMELKIEPLRGWYIGIYSSQGASGSPFNIDTHLTFLDTRMVPRVGSTRRCYKHEC